MTLIEPSMFTRCTEAAARALNAGGKPSDIVRAILDQLVEPTDAMILAMGKPLISNHDAKALFINMILAVEKPQ